MEKNDERLIGFEEINRLLHDNAKYLFVVNTGLVTRYLIEGGIIIFRDVTFVTSFL